MEKRRESINFVGEERISVVDGAEELKTRERRGENRAERLLLPVVVLSFEGLALLVDLSSLCW